MSKLSAGVLLVRHREGALGVLLAHPGGPFWAKKDAGAWSIPKGLVEPGEDLLAAAKREFEEEVGTALSGPFLELGTVQQKAGKVIHAWACLGDLDPATTTSTLISIEWPPNSGRQITVPEVDRCEWFHLDVARLKLNPAQVPFLDRVQTLLQPGRSTQS